MPVKNHYYLIPLSHLRTLLLGVSASLLTLPSAQAVERLETINVTATRTARTADETLASVTVITRKDIDRQQALTLPQVLSGLPGITFSSNGGIGKTTSLFLRGVNSNQLLVLIDGIRVGSASLGATAWEHLPVTQIERIEIVRGPQSHIYGSDAIGGVIQIFTRDGSAAKGFRLDGEIGYGTHDTSDGNLGISGGNGSTNYSLRVAGLKSNGFDSTQGNDPDDDGYRQASMSGNIKHHFENGLTFQLSGVRSAGNTEYDGFLADSDYDADFLQQSYVGKLSYALTPWWDLSVNAGESRDRSENYVDGRSDSIFETRRPQASWQNDFSIGDNGLLTAGIDFLRDKVGGTSSYSRTSRDNTGVFAQYLGDFGNNNLSIGLRYDDNESFGSHTTGSLAWGYAVLDSLRLIASYGTAFKAPTFNDLYYEDPFGSNGNPDLDPETSRSYELALEGTPEWGTWSLRLYRTDIDDLIQWTEIAPWVWQPQNIASARIDGLEVSASTVLSGWRLTAGLTLLNPVDSDTDKLLPSRNKQTFRLDVDRRFGATGLGATWRAYSHSYNDPENQTRIPGYGLVDLRLEHYFSPVWGIRGQVKNLFDKDYQTRAGYHEAGTELFLSVFYQSQ
ncbi:MAG: TonB-dependent receptor [Gammaproteobacteria bacterium]|nr:TonB-dependent receptor [Gammaproteobacteria bacterium]